MANAIGLLLLLLLFGL